MVFRLANLAPRHHFTFWQKSFVNTTLAGDASLCDVRSPRRRTDTHRVDVLRAVKLCWADGVRLSVAKGSPTFIASTTAGEGSPR
jgi:hypothetical protein